VTELLESHAPPIFEVIPNRVGTEIDKLDHRAVARINEEHALYQIRQFGLHYELAFLPFGH
jgi:hypothetical protein